MNDKGNLTDKRPPLLPTIIGTGLGSGFWPWGPGTAGSVLGTLIWAVIALFAGLDGTTLQTTMLLLTVVFTILGTWATAQLQPYWVGCLCGNHNGYYQNSMGMGKIKHELYTFGKAEVTASMGSAVDFGLAFMLSDIVGIYYGLANALGVMAGGVTNCCLNYRYVFGDSNRRKRSVAWRYFIVWAISWLLNSGGTIALTEFINSHERLDIHYLIPKSVVSILVALLVNYPAQRKFVFKPAKQKSAEEN